jgi:PiT family inorganic phosphate transporter
MEFTLLIVIIVIALLFDLVNGFHDAANSIATVVSTKVLTPGQAVLWAAFFNVLAFWIFDMSVGNTVAKTVDNDAINLWVILSGLIAATIWNLLTWKLGIPSSSSHTLIGGFAGAAIAHAGFDVVNSAEIYKVIAFIFLAPIIGGVISYIITIITIQRNPFKKIGFFALLTFGVLFLMQYVVEYMDVKPIMMWIVAIMMGVMLLYYIWYAVVHGKSQTVLKESNMYKKLQLLSSAAFSLGHGGADSQKVMGIICAACMVYANISREKGTEGSIDKNLQVTELMQIEYESADGKKEKFKPEHQNGDKIFVYTKGKDIYDSETNQIIFEGKKVNSAYPDSAQFTEYLVDGKLKDGYKVKTKVHSDSMPWWIAFGCYFAIGLGTLMGGWKIVKTMGTKITKVTPLEGVCAETAGALTLFTVSNMGIPVSTTHTITGAIIGVGATKRLSAVRWGVTISLLWAWVLTIPVSALIAALVYYFTTLFT